MISDFSVLKYILSVLGLKMNFCDQEEPLASAQAGVGSDSNNGEGNFDSMMLVMV